MAELYRATGRYTGWGALARQDKSLPSDHPNLAVVRENYAPVLDRLTGRGDGATALRAEAVVIDSDVSNRQSSP